MSNTKLEFAKLFLSMGIAIIPLRHKGKEPESNLMGGTWEKYKSSLPTQYDLARWLGSGWLNYGVIMGWNNLAVIDFDNTIAFDLWLDYMRVMLKYDVYAMPYIIRTSRGAHVYVSLPNGGNNQKRLGVDVKIHGYVVGPGSIHPSGVEYTALDTEYRLVDVFSLDTLLPLDLFPMVANTVPAVNIPAVPVQMSLGEYDPFAAASSGFDGDLITKVKSHVRIENLFSNVRRTSADGRWYATLCPFHDDKNPSMWIDTRRQLCGCATCAMKPLDVINLYARMHNISESIAVTQLAKEIGVWG